MIACYLLAAFASVEVHAADSLQLLTKSRGLSDNEITSFCTDDWNFLWIATLNGLNRFDGSHVRVFDSRNSPLHSSSIHDIVKLKPHILVAATEGGLLSIDTRTEHMALHKIPDDSPLGPYRNNFTQSIPLPEGYLAASSLYGIYIFDSTMQVRAKIEADFLPADIGVRRIHFALRMDRFSNGDMLLATTKGYFLFHFEKKQFIPLAAWKLPAYQPLKELLSGHLTSYIYNIDRHDNLFFIDNKVDNTDTIYVFNKRNQRISRSRVPFNPRVEISWNKKFQFHDDGTITLTRFPRGYYKFRYEAEGGRGLTPLEKLSGPAHVNHISYSPNGTQLYLGTNAGLLINTLRNDNIRYMELPLESGSNENVNVYCGYVTGNLLYFSTYGNQGSVKTIDLETGRLRGRVNTSDRENRRLVFEIAGWNADSLLAGTENGLMLIDRKSMQAVPFSRVYPIPGEMTGIVSALWTDGNQLWVAFATGGAWHFNRSTGAVTHFPNGRGSGKLAIRASQSIARDQAGDFWFHHYSDGITRFNSRTARFDLLIRHIKNQQGNLIPLTGMAPAAGGGLWVFSNGQGLYHYDFGNDRVQLEIPLTDRAAENVNPLAVNDSGWIAISLKNSLTMYHPGRRQITSLAMPQGNASLQNRFKRPVFGKDPESVLVGYSYLMMQWNYRDELRQQAAPETYITSVESTNDHSRWNRFMSMRIPHSKNDLLITFGTPVFQSTLTVQYEYSLAKDGAGESWIPLGFQPFVHLNDLHAGNYVFKVRSVSLSSFASGAESSFSFEIIPPYYARLWFKLLIIAMIAAVLYAIYRIRQRQLVKMQAVKQAISADLHDEVGSRITNLRFLNEMALNKDGNGNGPLLKKMGEELEKSADVLHQIVYRMHRKDTSLEDLVALVRREAVDSLDAANIQVNFTGHIISREKILPADQFHDLFLIAKEVFHNIKKHSGATEVSVSLQEQGGNLVMDIADNGRGFDPAAGSNRNGRIILSQRVKKWNGSLQYDTAPGMGTRISIRTKLRYPSPIKRIARSLFNK